MFYDELLEETLYIPSTTILLDNFLGENIDTLNFDLRHKIPCSSWCQQIRYYPYLETLTLFVSPRTAVSLGGSRAYKKG